MWNLKESDINELIYKIEIDPQILKTILWLTRGNVESGGINYEFGINLYTLLYVNWKINKDLL